MFHGGGGGGVGRTCMSLPLGKYLRRALRGSGTRGKPRLRDREQTMQGLATSVELIASSSSAASASWSMSAAASASSSPPSPVVRVVLWSGLVEVYTGVVLACTVIRRHPPGLCLAHTDVFRNPHRATLRPLEPLFPGQKFFLLPETTVRKLQRNIPLDVRSVPAAVPCPQAVGDEGEEEGEEEETSSAEMSPSRSRSWSEEDREQAPREKCFAKDYYVNRERWAECQFKSMVERGLAADQSSSSSSSRRSAADKRYRKKMRKTKPAGRGDLLGVGAMPLPSTSRAWQPTLPPVQEEAAPSSPEPQTATTSPASCQDRSRAGVVS